MSTITRAFNAKEKTNKRYCSVYESLDKSLKEVKLHREGIYLDTWEEYLEKKHSKERDK